MKKIFSILTATLLLSSSLACQSETTTSPIAEEKENSVSPISFSEVSEEPEETANLALGEKINLDDWEITVNSYEIDDSIKSSEYTGFKSDEGSKYVSVSMTVKNLGVKVNTFVDYISFTNETIKCKIFYQNKYEYTSTNLLGYDLDLHYKQLNPLESFTGVMAYSIVDEAAMSNELTFHISFGKDTYVYRLENPVAAAPSVETVIAEATSEEKQIDFSSSPEIPSPSSSDQYTRKGEGIYYLVIDEEAQIFYKPLGYFTSEYGIKLYDITAGHEGSPRFESSRAGMSIEISDYTDYYGQTNWKASINDIRMMKEDDRLLICESDLLSRFGFM